MHYIKGIIVTYLAIYGIVFIAPFFLLIVSIPAVLVGGFLSMVGLSEDIAMIGSMITVFVSVYIFFQIYSAVRFKRMERLANSDDEIS